MKNNKRTTLASMMAVLIASTLLCSLCSLFFYNQTAWQRDVEIYEGGDWHAEVGGYITKEGLEQIDNNLNIRRTMVKGPFLSVKLPEESRLPYLMLRDADKDYWECMAEKKCNNGGESTRKARER